MKKTSFLLLTLIITMSAAAQNFRVNGYAGYVFDDEVSEFATANNYFQGQVNGGFQWGVGLEYIVQQSTGIELMYFRQDTKAPITYWDNGDKLKEFDLSVNWITIGAVHYFISNPKIHPYAGGLLGIAIMDVSNSLGGNSSATKFAWGIRTGAIFWAAEKVGIKLQAGFTSAMQGIGGTLYFGSGGSTIGASSYSSLFQFGLNGGLAIKLGGESKK